MARSLGFAAYRALSQRRSRPARTIVGQRPAGEVLWLHAASTERIAALCQLGDRVQALRDDLTVLVTLGPGPDGTPPALPGPNTPDPDAPRIQVNRFTSDHPLEARQFLDHWQPDICLWAGAVLLPNLISQTADRGIAMILFDVGQDDFPTRRHKWFPDLTRSSLKRFETIMTTSPPALDMLRRIGVPSHKISVAEPLCNGPSPLPIAEADLSGTSQEIAGRPLWLAAHAQTDEFVPILAAHRAALRLVHRLLLVLSVADPDRLAALKASVGASGLRFARWRIGDDIDENTQVLITDGIDDLGLWYRMAPLTFMASSLTIDNTGRSPLAVAALGSAVLVGPHVSDHQASYSRLIVGRAGLVVDDADALGAAVIRLVAPDHAAAMALAGWEVVTKGAALTDQLVELVQDRLDVRGAGHART